MIHWQNDQDICQDIMQNIDIYTTLLLDPQINTACFLLSSDVF